MKKKLGILGIAVACAGIAGADIVYYNDFSNPVTAAAGVTATTNAAGSVSSGAFTTTTGNGMLMINMSALDLESDANLSSIKITINGATQPSGGAWTAIGFRSNTDAFANGAGDAVYTRLGGNSQLAVFDAPKSANADAIATNRLTWAGMTHASAGFPDVGGFNTSLTSGNDYTLEFLFDVISNTSTVTLTWNGGANSGTVSWANTNAVPLDYVLLQLNATNAKVYDIKVEAEMVPEPATLGLFLLAGIGSLFFRRVTKK